MNMPKMAKALTDAALAGPDLQPWDSGPAVAELQQLLRAHGFELRVDGTFDSLTEVAVKLYQRRQGLRVNGTVEYKTWAALKSTVQPGSRVLRPGHTGADVRELQGLLQVHGYSVPRDGIFRTETKRAVIDFQQTHRLKVSGSVDAITWTALRGRPLPEPPKRVMWLIKNCKWW